MDNLSIDIMIDMTTQVMFICDDIDTAVAIKSDCRTELKRCNLEYVCPHEIDLNFVSSYLVCVSTFASLFFLSLYVDQWCDSLTK